jgi:hypothetical protein
MVKRKYLYWAGGIVAAVAIVASCIVVFNKDDAKPASAKPDSNNSTAADQGAESTPIKSSDVKTPTNNSELANTLNDDAAAIGTSVRNYENNDYDDSNLTDKALYE